MAERYAAALFDLADERRTLDEAAGDLRQLRGMLESSGDFLRLIRSPVLSRGEQAKAIGVLAERAELSSLVRDFLAVIARNRRLFAVPAIIEAFLYKLAARRGLGGDYSQSRSRHYRASQFDEAEEFQRHDEHPARYAAPARAERDDSYYFDRYAAQDPHEEGAHDPLHHWLGGGLATALALIGWAVVATAGAYACRTYFFGPVSTQTSAAPSQAKPAQPGIRGAPPVAATSGYLVQVSAQRSKADAEASFRSLQEKFPAQLGRRTATIRRVDLGAKGIYYRAFVGPFPSAGEADQFCGKFKTSGGQCFVQRN